MKVRSRRLLHHQCLHPRYCRVLDWIPEFNAFINSPEAPRSAKLTYQRVMQRAIDKMTGYEPVAKKEDHSTNPLSAEDEELLLLTGQKAAPEYDADDMYFQKMEKGLDFKWDKAPKVSSMYSHIFF